MRQTPMARKYLLSASNSASVTPTGLLCSMTMERVEISPTQKTHCAGCGQIVPSYDIVNVGSVEQGYRALCGQCFNTKVAKLDGLDRFEHVTLEPVRLADCTGETHEFHFRTFLFGTGIALDGFELHDGHPAGYQFQIIGDPEEDLLVLLGRLIEKIRRGLSIKHLKNDTYGLQIAEHRVVRGKIESDDSEDELMPLLNIDGREITWQEFGRILMSFEGCQFKLEIRDKSEDL
jgi:hypothetical protein